MLTLPTSPAVPLVRTDFTDDAGWRRVQDEIATPSEDGFLAGVSVVDDRAYEGADERAIAAGLPGRYPDAYLHPVVFVVDARTFRDPDHPILVLDAGEEPVPSFRTIPGELWSVENNLSLANMDIEEFADATDADGVYRGF